MQPTLISCDKNVLGGTPVFAGTRVPVKMLFEYLTKNHPLDDFLDDFPTVARAQAQQVMEQAQKTLQESLGEAAIRRTPRPERWHH